MSIKTTPGIERGIEALRNADDCGLDDDVVIRNTLAAVLDDLDDLARILRGTEPQAWRTVDPDTKARWTVEARRVRTALLGADS
jgi:hypothetical protein